jgi:hypothetical protein
LAVLQAGFPAQRAVQYHLHHPENWVDQSENLALMAESKKRRLTGVATDLKKTLFISIKVDRVGLVQPSRPEKFISFP